MTPEERQRVGELFDRLGQLESAPRDPDAERAIADGLKRAPNAAYALVQTALVQDEALKRADARIRELSGNQQPQSGGGFLDSMRAALGSSSRHTSVPSVRASDQPDPRWNSGGTYAATATAPVAPPASGGPFGGGGSFLGTAAASAAGFIGGALLLNSISSMFGQHSGSAFADVPRDSSPWDSGAANSDLARDAGINDIGGGQQASLFGDANDNDVGDVADAGDDFGGDFGGGDAA
jgi:hypothetical protein